MVQSPSDMRLLIAGLMNEIQCKHSELVESLRGQIGMTSEFENALCVLQQVYEAKMDLLDKIYQEIG